MLSEVCVILSRGGLPTRGVCLLRDEVCLLGGPSPGDHPGSDIYWRPLQRWEHILLEYISVI